MTDFLSAQETQMVQPGQVVVNVGLDVWKTWNNASNLAGALIGMALTGAMPGTAFIVVTLGRYPLTAFNLGAGNPSPVQAGNKPSRSPNNAGQIIGNCDASGEIFLLGATIGSSPTIPASVPTAINVAALRTTTTNSTNAIQLLGYNNPNDGGQGDFWWDSASVAADDGGTIFAVAGVATGRWRRLAAAQGHSVNVAWFGGLPLTNFYNSSNGRWYQDVGLSIEAGDNAAQVQTAINYAIANNIADVYLPSGTWYFKAKQGTKNEFVRLSAGNLTIRGDGLTSKIVVQPGMNVAGVGYSCILGNGDAAFAVEAATRIDNIRVTNLAFDHQAQFNQWGSGTYAGQPNNIAANAAVMVVQGDRITYDHLHVYNHNGIFALVAGTYGDDVSGLTTGNYLASNVTIDSCILKSLGVDPHGGDASMVSGGALGITCSNNRFSQKIVNITGAVSNGGPNLVRLTVTDGTSTHTTSSTTGMFTGMVVFNQKVRGTTEANGTFLITVIDGQTIDLQSTTFSNAYVGGGTLEVYTPFATAIELHGFNINVANNVCQGMHRFMNLGGDSLPCGNYTIADNASLHCALFVTAFPQNGLVTQGLKISDNMVATIKELPAGPPNNSGALFNTVDGDGTIVPYGAGIFDCEITGNVAMWVGPETATTGLGGITFVTNTGGGVLGGGLKISDNKFYNYRQGTGITVAVNRQANTGNLLDDVNVENNLIENCGTEGILISGGAGDSSPQFKNLRVVYNKLRNSLGTMSFGVLVTGFTDSSCLVWRNDAPDATSAPELFDTTNYPTTQSSYLPDFGAHSLAITENNLTSTVSNGLLLSNNTAGTGGVPVQNSPGTRRQGHAFYSAADHTQSIIDFVQPDPSGPIWQWQYTIDGSSTTFATWFPNSAVDLLPSIAYSFSTVNPGLSIGIQQGNNPTNNMVFVSQAPSGTATGGNLAPGGYDFKISATGNAALVGRLNLWDLSFGGTSHPMWQWAASTSISNAAGWWAYSNDPATNPLDWAFGASATDTYVGGKATANVHVGVHNVDVITVQSAKVGFYGASPTAQQTRMTTLTSGAGTSQSGTADVGGAFSQTTLNNNFATLVNRINQLDTIVHTLGLST